MIAVLDNGGFSALVPNDERARARLRALRVLAEDIAIPTAVFAEGLLSGHPGHDHHARKLLDLLRSCDVDDTVGHAAGRLRTSARKNGADPPPSGVDAIVVAQADVEASRSPVTVVTSDAGDIAALAAFAQHAERIAIRSV